MSQSKEVLFAQTLEKVRSLAKEQGNCVSEEQVREAFAEQDLDESQMQLVFDYLVKRKVGIGQPVDLDEYLTDDEMWIEEKNRLSFRGFMNREVYGKIVK